MEKLNVTIGFIGGLFSLALLLAQDWVAAAACGTLALGFGLSDLAYAPALPTGAAATAPLPTWRRHSSMLLVCAAILLFGYQIGQDLHLAINGRHAESSASR